MGIQKCDNLNLDLDLRNTRVPRTSPPIRKSKIHPGKSWWKKNLRDSMASKGVHCSPHSAQKQHCAIVVQAFAPFGDTRDVTAHTENE